MYDLRKKEFRPDVKIEHAFAIPDYYPDEMEKAFNIKTEAAFGDLLNNIILKAAEKQIELNRVQLNRVKKFLLLLILRSALQDKWLEGAMAFQGQIERLNKAMGVKRDVLFSFREKRIEGETPRQYWLRSLKCVLDTENGLPEEIEKDPNATMMAWRWAWVVMSGYLGFWSSRNTNVDFLVTDIGMTSESEALIGENLTLNRKKITTLIQCGMMVPDVPSMRMCKNQFYEIARRQVYFHENFMEFPISKDLMIVLINPYYKVYASYKDEGFPFPSFRELTKLEDERAFSPNDAKRVNGDAPTKDDLYVYDIHDLDERCCIYLNLLTLDRIDTTLGFADPSRILSSLLSYQAVPGKLNDYSELISQIQRRACNV